jgi:hypothetical protein
MGLSTRSINGKAAIGCEIVTKVGSGNRSGSSGGSFFRTEADTCKYADVTLTFEFPAAKADVRSAPATFRLA